jgi:aspartyl-tRNA(Asn)/glutamyl-tRNA(Gln) amidotransferase subunit B
MRFDVNVSVSDKENELGTRTETKNINSFRAVEKAVEYEIKRQTEALNKQQKIIQETRGWDEAKQKTFSQRSKEEANDYRYFPEPDIPPIVLDDAYIEQIRSELPVMPSEWRRRLKELGLSKSHIETLLDAEVEEPDTHYLSIIEDNINDRGYAVFIANWEINLEIPLRHATPGKVTLSDANKHKAFSETYQLTRAGKLSSSRAKDLLTDLLMESEFPLNIEDFARSKGYIQESDEGIIAAIVAKVLELNPAAVQDIKHGESKAIGFLVGEVMKASAGKANPGIAQELIRKQINAE